MNELSKAVYVVQRQYRKLDVMRVRFEGCQDGQDGLRKEALVSSSFRVPHQARTASMKLNAPEWTHGHVVGRRPDALGLAARARRVAEICHRVLGVRHLVGLHLLVRDQVVESLEARRGGTGFVGAEGEDDPLRLLGGGPAELGGCRKGSLEDVGVDEELQENRE